MKQKVVKDVFRLTSSTYLKLNLVSLRHGLHDIRLLFMLGSFSETCAKTLWSISVYTKLGKQPSDTILCQNNFITVTTIDFLPLPICEAIDQTHLY